MTIVPAAPLLRLVALLSTVVFLLAVPVGAASAAPTETGSRSLQDLGACMTSTGHADVLLLIDQSGSLRKSDPEAARVAAAQLLLARLADTADRTGSTIDLAVSGFDAQVRQALDWTPLDDSTLPGASAAVQDFAGREDGFETDYWTALTAAHQQLVDHRSTGTGTHCQTLVLFTDGQFDLAAREDAGDEQEYGRTKAIPGVEDVPLTSEDAATRVEQAGRDELCRPGGVADGLRSDQILLIALGLNAGGDVDLGLLNGIAESQPQACGAQEPRGLFLAVTDVNDLVLAFDRVGDPANPPLPEEQRGVCELALCPQEAHSFTLDSSIRSIHLLGTSSAKGIDVYVRPPGVPPVELSYATSGPTGSVPAGSLSLGYSWYADGAFAIDVQAPPTGEDWSGTWQVVFVDPTGRNPDAVSKTQLTIQADLGAVVRRAEAVEWRAGETVGPVVFDLVRSNGEPTVLGRPAPTLALDVSLHSAAGTAVPLASGLSPAQFQAGVPLTVPADFPAGPTELRSSLAVTTVSGLTLQPQVRSQELTVLPALGFPSVRERSADFGTVERTVAGTDEITVAGPGCVWVAGAPTLTAQPADVGADGVRVTGPTEDDPTCLGDGETTEIPLELASEVSAAGQLSGTFTVHLAPEGRLGRDAPVELPFRAVLERDANAQVFWAALAGALVVGIGLPVLVLLLARWLAARLPSTPLQSAVLDVRIGPGGLRAATGGPVTVPERWDLVPPPESARRRTRLSLVPVRARAGARITDAGYAEVHDDRWIGVSGAPGSRSSRTLRARLPLALQGSWTLLLDRTVAASGEADVPARLLVVSDPAAITQQREEILARARQEAPAAVEALRAAARKGRTDDAPGAGTGSAPDTTPTPEDPFGRVPGPRSDPSSGIGPAGRDPFGTSGATPPSPTPPPMDDPFRRRG